MGDKRTVSVTGLGYVGLPVAVAFGRKGPVVAFDVKPERIRELKDGRDSTNEISREELVAADIEFTSEATDLARVNFHIIAVPTPINKAKYPDLSALLAASRTLGAQLKQGDIVVYESTVYPGATEEECIPVLAISSIPSRP